MYVPGYMSITLLPFVGNVQIWDIRVPNKFERQFTAHGEHVLSIDFHPDEKNWLATSGRDRLIKVCVMHYIMSLLVIQFTCLTCSYRTSFIYASPHVVASCRFGI